MAFSRGARREAREASIIIRDHLAERRQTKIPTPRAALGNEPTPVKALSNKQMINGNALDG
jgi:hypothetical protein